MNAPISIVTGANRGIGLEVSRQLGRRGHTVYLGSRNTESGARAVGQLADQGIDARPLNLDVADPDSIAEAVGHVSNDIGRVDVVVNNAAIHYDTSNLATRPDMDLVREALETNVFGAWNTTLAFLPLLRSSDHGRIVNVSSGAGSLTDMGGGLAAYHLSKVSLNALTRMWAAELRTDRILVNSICPGWVATDMGGHGGRPVTDGATGIVWAATLPDNGPSGGFYRDQQPIPW